MNPKQTVDFSPFDVSRIKRTGNALLVVGVGVLMILAPFVLLIVLWLLFMQSPLLFLAVFVGLMAIALRYMMRSAARAQRVLQQFIAANGFTSGQQAPLGPLLQKLGYEARPTILNGELDGHKFWLFLAEPEHTNGGNYREITLFTIEFSRQLPSLLLFPDAGIMSPLVDNMAKGSFGLIPLELEGDFNKHVKAYYQGGAQINSLEYLTPDVMAVVEDKVSDIVLYDGNYLSVSTSMPVPQSVDALRSLFHSAQLLIKEIDEKPAATL